MIEEFRVFKERIGIPMGVFGFALFRLRFAVSGAGPCILAVSWLAHSCTVLPFTRSDCLIRILGLWFLTSGHPSVGFWDLLARGLDDRRIFSLKHGLWYICVPFVVYWNGLSWC